MKARTTQIGPIEFWLALLLTACNPGDLPSDSQQTETPTTWAQPIDLTDDADLAERSHYGYLVVKSELPLDEAVFDALGARLVDQFIHLGTWYGYVHRDSDVSGLIRLIYKQPGVVYVEPDQVAQLHDDNEYRNGLNDPFLAAAQYSFQVTELDYALKVFGVGDHMAYVGILDSGLNIPHEEFNGVSVQGHSMFARTDDGYDFVGFKNNPISMDAINWEQEGSGHGTHVTGILGARGNNGTGISGVCPANVTLLPYKVFAYGSDGSPAEGSGSNWAIYGALKHLVDWKVDQQLDATIPVNISSGSAWAGQFAVEMIHYALQNNVLVVASSGNSGQNTTNYPAALPGVIAVGASDGRDRRVAFSGQGSYLSVLAPGVDIISTSNRNDHDYVMMGGTSMAAPFVTGLIALLLTHNPHLSPAQIKQIIEDTADDLAPAGFDPDSGYGRVNAYGALFRVSLGLVPKTQRYASHTLTVQVRNTKPQEYGLQSQPVFLYDQNGTYVHSTITDYYGDAHFDLLVPGRYTLVSNFFDEVQQASVDFRGLEDVVTRLDFTHNVWYIQTLMNDSGDETDTVIGLYDDQQNLITFYDMFKLDTLMYELEAGKTYYIGISGYQNEDGSYATGHYTLLVSPVLEERAFGMATLNGQDDAWEPNANLDNAYAIEPYTFYHAYLADYDGWGDFDGYRITIE